MLKSQWAPGRSYLLFSTDEIAPGFFDFNNSPTNILALRTSVTKVGVYSNWLPATTRIDRATVQLEFYDYSSRAGRLELISHPTTPVPNQPGTAQDKYHCVNACELPKVKKSWIAPAYKVMIR